MQPYATEYNHMQPYMQLQFLISGSSFQMSFSTDNWSMGAPGGDIRLQ